jgi:hypothetical protein
MRKTFTKLDGTSSSTTPEPTCKAAQKAYKDHCAVMREEKTTHCTNLAAYEKLNPKCNADCLAGHLSELKVFYDNIAEQDVIINDPNSSSKQKAAAEIKIDKNNNRIETYLAGVNKDVPKAKAKKISDALNGLAAREISRKVLSDTLTELKKVIGSFKSPRCKLPNPSFDPPCKTDKKKKAHSERLKQKRQSKK